MIPSSKHSSNTDLDKLRDLILEFDKIVFKLDSASGIHTNLKTTLAKIKHDVDALQNFAVGQAQVICSLTNSSYIKGVVNSALDTVSVDDTLAELKVFKLPR